MTERPDSAGKDAGLTEAQIERLCDAFVGANRAEFMDTDFDLPILHTIAALVVEAWHEGYGAGSSNATDGWLKPGSPRTLNPYTVRHPLSCGVVGGGKCDCTPAISPPAREVWDDRVAPGGYVCSECGMPSESEPCEHLTRPLSPAGEDT